MEDDPGADPSARSGAPACRAPDEEVFRAHIEEIRDVGVHLRGRRLYETMLYRETAEQEQSLDDVEREWARLWNPLPKVGRCHRCRATPVEYRVWIYPVLVGGGIPFFPRHERRVELELVETRTFRSKVVRLGYRVAR